MKMSQLKNKQNGEKNCCIQHHTASGMRGGIAGAVEERDAPGAASRRGSPLPGGWPGHIPAPAPALGAGRRLLGHVKSLRRLPLRRRQSAAAHCNSSAGAEPPAHRAPPHAAADTGRWRAAVRACCSSFSWGSSAVSARVPVPRG